MEEARTYTINEAHQHFAKSTNGRVWELSQKPDRSRADDDEMLYAAHACTYHWKYAGTAIHQQRGEWLISHVHVVLGNATEAVRHARRCFELTEANKDLMQDFDIAYAYEGLARVHALSRNQKEAREFFERARQAGDMIEDGEDKTIFIGDINGGDWFGIK